MMFADVPRVGQRMKMWATRLVVDSCRTYVRFAPGQVGKSLLVRYVVVGGLRKYPYRGLTRTRSGEVFDVETADLIQLYLHLFGVWEPHTQHWMLSQLRDGDVVVDVGANIGAVSLPAAHAVGPTGQVVSIEASPAIAGQLRRNAELNDLGNIRIVNAAVSDHVERLTFYMETHFNQGATSVIDHGTSEATFEIEARPLPELLTADEIDRVRVIKIDVEGEEAAVVKSLLPILPRLRSDVELIIELTPDFLAARNVTPSDIIDPLLSAGFHAYKSVNDYSPWSYPGAIRRPIAPQRWDGTIESQFDLIFSRKDAPALH